jgi:hypothetical protein
MQAILDATLVLILASAQTPVLDRLKNQFNQDQGALRLIVLVSPTCPECTTGAEWIQEYVLKRNPKLNIRVYSVWYQMYPGDSPRHFPGAQKRMPDRRVSHFWDQPKDIGRWFRTAVPTDYQGEIQWDAFYLYGADSVWTDTPTSLLTWGRTILKDRKKLTDTIAQLLRGDQ